MPNIPTTFDAAVEYFANRLPRRAYEYIIPSMGLDELKLIKAGLYAKSTRSFLEKYLQEQPNRTQQSIVSVVRARMIKLLDERDEYPQEYKSEKHFSSMDHSMRGEGNPLVPFVRSIIQRIMRGSQNKDIPEGVRRHEKHPPGRAHERRED